jgi:DNA repair exonuclease SbcCD ATPase subunit
MHCPNGYDKIKEQLEQGAPGSASRRIHRARLCSDGCKETGTHAELAAHEHQCDFREIKCKRAKLGCEWSGANHAASAHCRECPFDQLAPRLEGFQDQIKKLEDARNRQIREFEEQKRQLQNEQRRTAKHRESAENLQEQLRERKTLKDLQLAAVVVGGMSEDGVALGSVEALNEKTKHWEPQQSMRSPRAGCAAAATLQGGVFVAGVFRLPFLAHSRVLP